MGVITGSSVCAILQMCSQSDKRVLSAPLHHCMGPKVVHSFLFLFWVKSFMWNTEANWIAVFRGVQCPQVPEWLQREGPSHAPTSSVYRLITFCVGRCLICSACILSVEEAAALCVDQHMLCHKWGPWIPEKILGMKEAVKEEWVPELHVENQRPGATEDWIFSLCKETWNSGL